MHDLKSRYDIGWFSAYDTLKGMVVLYGADKVQEALNEILSGLTKRAADGAVCTCLIMSGELGDNHREDCPCYSPRR